MRGPAPSRNAFTLIEALTFMAVISILAVLSLGTLQRLKESADQTVCVSNLKQWGTALTLYAADHDLSTPRRGQGIQPVEIVDRQDDWFNCLPAYMGLPSYQMVVAQGKPARPGDKSVWVCPAAVNKGNHPHFICYGMNMYFSYTRRPQPHRLNELPGISKLAFMADAPGGWASTVPSSEGYSVQARHSGRANVAFADGHVATFTGEYLGCGTGEPDRPDIRWKTLAPNDDFRSLP